MLINRLRYFDYCSLVGRCSVKIVVDSTALVANEMSACIAFYIWCIKYEKDVSVCLFAHTTSDFNNGVVTNETNVTSVAL